MDRQQVEAVFELLPSSHYNPVFIVGDENEVIEMLSHRSSNYIVLDVATHTESGEKLVIYKSLKDENVWARPLSMWNEVVDYEKNIIRFNRIKDEQI